MKNITTNSRNHDIDSNSFLGNVMPHIKVSKKSFPLKGIDLVKHEGAFSLIPANYFAE